MGTIDVYYTTIATALHLVSAAEFHAAAVAACAPPPQVEKNTSLIISSADKVQLGLYCAEIRRQRPPEPYKGKGIRYAGEVIKLKEGKGGGKKK